MTHVCRRICFLRERGDLAQAAQLEHVDLAAALVRCRTLHDDAVVATRLHAIFAAESDRVATAAVVAEFLHLQNAASHATAANLAALTPFEPIRDAAAPDTAIPSPAAISNSSASARPAPGTDIAAFIDQMLAMHEPDQPPPQRRAS